MVILKSKYFTLRQHKIDDATRIYELQQDEETKKNIMGIPKSVSQVKNDIIKLKKNKKEKSFVIEIDGKVAGEISLYQLESYNNKKLRLSMWIAKPLRKKGIGTRILKFIVDYAFKKYKIKRLEGSCRTFNKASARMMEKAGFKLEGILRKNSYKKGKFYDTMMWAVVK